ncbi:hypothetical protein PAXRUDRAFT_785830 [Paxillus rubicundulus Ve08.2h10]|uniref:Uncharacterized protein n=1 Tax=Paxillus rubicundulus Ve08.2h10 TaxID=930991 RepID=A0A0D0E7B6_9AGAM|nr:hypothetical protein PAXRUDRAFT_785830 [Paxillus rubicundulus Ve08.2h10]
MGWDYSIKLCLTPSLKSAERALDNIKQLLKPPRNSRSGYNWPNFAPVLGEQLEWMKNFLWTFCDLTRKAEAKGDQSPHWISASLATAQMAMKGKWCARNLHLWSKAYIPDQEDLPLDCFGDWKTSKIDNEDLAAELHLHLQGISKYIKAND